MNKIVWRVDPQKKLESKIGAQFGRNPNRRRPSRTKNPAIICTECDGRVDTKSDIKIRKVDDHPGVLEMGLLCPSCGHWYHSMFEDDRVRELRERFRRAQVRAVQNPNKAAVQEKMAKCLKEFRQYLDDFNGRLRDELGVKPATIGER